VTFFLTTEITVQRLDKAHFDLWNAFAVLGSDRIRTEGSF
jgi:hypothetical protein